MIIIIWSIPTFDYIWILTQGGPAYSSEVVATNLYSQAFDRFNVGYSSAIGTLMCIYTMFIVSMFAILRKLGWDIGKRKGRYIKDIYELKKYRIFKHKNRIKK